MREYISQGVKSMHGENGRTYMAFLESSIKRKNNFIILLLDYNYWDINYLMVQLVTVEV